MKVFFRRAALYLFALWSFFPLYWLLNTSFKTSKDALARPPTFIFKPIMKNYIEVIKNKFFEVPITYNRRIVKNNQHFDIFLF